MSLLPFKFHTEWCVHTKTLIQWWILGCVWIGWCLYHGHYLESSLHGGTITAVSIAHDRIYRHADPGKYPFLLYVTFFAIWVLGPGSILFGILLPEVHHH